MVNQKHTSKVETWDYVAETYLEEITDSEEEIADTLISIIQCLCNQSENISAIELGSGSGHLSTLFAKQGIDVTLLDFSPKSLDFAKKMFSKHSVQGNYICQDLFDLHIDKKYDIVWNCGVLEHFNDGELDEIIRNLKTIQTRYFIFIVPNAISIPYLLYRHQMDSTDSWIWGREFLRTDYINRFKQEGFKYVDCFYVGTKFTEYIMNVALKKDFLYKENITNNIIDKNSNALIGFIFKTGEEEAMKLDFMQKNIGVTELKTSVFELQNRLNYASDVINTLHAENDQKDQKNQILKDKLENIENENSDLKERCILLHAENEKYQAEIEELQKALKEFKKKEEERIKQNEIPPKKSFKYFFTHSLFSQRSN